MRLGRVLQIPSDPAEKVTVGVARGFLFTVAAGSMILGTLGVLSVALSTLLWLSSVLVLACHPASPLVRMISGALLRGVWSAPIS